MHEGDQYKKKPRLCCFCSVHLKLQKGVTCRCCHHWQWLALDHVVSGPNFILGSCIIYVYSSCPGYGELFLSLRRLFSHLSSASFNQVSASPLTEALLWIWTCLPLLSCTDPAVFYQINYVTDVSPPPHHFWSPNNYMKANLFPGIECHSKFALPSFTALLLK